MDKFGVDATNIRETPNFVTVKQNPVNNSMSTFIGALGTAAVRGLQVDQEVKADTFRKEYEEMFRGEISTAMQNIGMGAGIPATPGGELPAEGSGAAGQPLSQNDMEFMQFATRAEQASRIGGVGNALLRMEDVLRQRMAANPWYAKRYRQVAENVKGDYVHFLRGVEAQEQALADKMKSDAAMQSARVKRIAQNMKDTGVTTNSIFGEFRRLEEMTPEELDYVEQESARRQSSFVLWDKYREYNGELREQAGALRAEEDQGFQRTNQGMAVNRYNIDMREVERKENERALQTNVVQGIYGKIVPGMNELFDKHRGDWDPAEAGLALANIRRGAEQQVAQELLFYPDGTPTGYSPEKVKEAQDYIVDSFIAPLEKLVAAGPEAYKAAWTQLRYMNANEVGKYLPLVVGMGEVAPGYMASPTVATTMTRAQTQDKRTLATALDTELRGFMGNVAQPAINVANDVFSKGAEQLREADFGTAGAISFTGIMAANTRDDPANLMFSDARMPQAYANSWEALEKSWIAVPPSSKDQADRTIFGGDFMANFGKLPTGDRQRAAEAALKIAKSGIKDLLLDAQQPHVRGDVDWDDAESRFFSKSGKNARLAESLTFKAQTALFLNANTAHPIDDGELMMRLFDVEPEEDESAQ